MKVLAINGSARPNGNTVILIRTIFAELEKQGIETEMIQLAGSQLRGCAACYGCFRTKNNKCVISEDILNECVAKMMAADGIILASPTYFADVSAEMKSLIDRAGLVSSANGGLFKHKVAAAVSAVAFMAAHVTASGTTNARSRRTDGYLDSAFARGSGRASSASSASSKP